jgi:predicted amidophosphoribosyltransferase
MKRNRYIICSSCQAMSPSFETTCDQCGASLSLPETVDSIEPKVRRTYFQTPSTLRLIGMWALSLPNVIASAYVAFWLFRRRGGLAEFLIFWGLLGLGGLWLIIWYRVTKHYFFRRRQPPNDL